ncbi:hypothetical protein GY45DRAFT_1329232 [Cubamyces sp. BRFM 1775]|nr:hypothetical protein GY45DRAFT_1329232 [Cubamyces sp. BRFM 1775]
MTSQRLPLLQHRLTLPRRRQREAISRLYFSEHPFAVEQLRRAPGTPIPRNFRVCRFCRDSGAVEDEVHILQHPPIKHLLHRLHGPAVLDALLNTPQTLGVFADYVADVYDVCNDTPLLVARSEQELATITGPPL